MIAAREAHLGILYGLAAFVHWGLVVPAYIRLLDPVPAAEVLCHRIVWAAVFSLALVALARRWRELGRALAPRVLGQLALSASLIGANWALFIFAVNSDRLVEASLGYFMAPLANVALGLIFLGERLRPTQATACLVAAAGVALLTVLTGGFPWLPLGLALTFAFYALARKLVRVEALVGFAVEALLLAPLAGAYLLWLAVAGEGSFAWGAPATDALLLGSGVATALPLIWFAAAARRLTLATVGLLQYAAPSCTLLLGTLAFGESFAATDGLAFGAIWSGLGLYTIDALRRQHRP